MEVASSAAATTTLAGTLRVTNHVRRDGTTKILYTLETANGVKTLKLPGVPPETMKTRKAVKKAMKANPDRLVQVTGAPATTERSRAVGDAAANAAADLRTTAVDTAVQDTRSSSSLGAARLERRPQRGQRVLWALTDPNRWPRTYRVTTNNVVRVNGTVMTVTLPGGVEAGQTCVPWEAVVKRTQENPALMARLAPYTNVMFLPHTRRPQRVPSSASGT